VVNETPIFPLRTVLVPGGFLPLQIFEPRYLDMVRDCARSGAGFGVCLILQGQEAGRVPQHARIGTVARIRDFHTLENGLLGIVAQGHERFRIERTWMRDNGLLVADIHLLEAHGGRPLPADYALLGTIAERLMEKLEGNYPDYHPGCLDDAAWVSFRLTELLPMENQQRLELLEMDQPEDRLQRLLEMMPRFSSP
jgi:Lon protease-like protein